MTLLQTAGNLTNLTEWKLLEHLAFQIIYDLYSILYSVLLSQQSFNYDFCEDSSNWLWPVSVSWVFLFILVSDVKFLPYPN